VPTLAVRGLIVAVAAEPVVTVDPTMITIHRP
jgi:hypothetical protein